MQPRLVAISYPSAHDEGYGDHEISDSYEQNDTSRRLSSRLSQRFRRLSWQELKSSISMPSRKRSSMNREVTFQLLQPSSELPLSSSTSKKTHLVDHANDSPWQRLPENVQQNILDHLESAYSHRPDVDAYRLRRNDLVAAQLSCKAWSKFAQRRLYEKIQLKPTYDRDWYAADPRNRHVKIIRLRRTLRSSPKLANLVKHLLLLPENNLHDEETLLFSDLVASVVMSCPMLETLTTFHVLYTHDFNRLFQALSTRIKLTQHTWVIGEDEFVQSRARRRNAGILSNQQTRMFLQYHANWKELRTLNIVSHRSRGVLEHQLFVNALNMLPSLKSLHVSSFDANDFSDDTLLALPPLQSLRLSYCQGVSESGLCEWADSPAGAVVQHLVLESQNITSLLTVSTLFQSLFCLETFRMIQLEYEPGLPLELDVIEPMFSSASLRILEWFVASGWDPENQPFQENSPRASLHEQLQSWTHSKSSRHLLSSILDYGFPRLQKILLPGYGNLDGLLRWVRHTSSASLLSNLPSNLRSNLDEPLSAKSNATDVEGRRSSWRSSWGSGNRSSWRSSRRISYRPSSPNFAEYDHWRQNPAPSTYVLEEIIELPERPHTTPPETSPASSQSIIEQEEDTVSVTSHTLRRSQSTHSGSNRSSTSDSTRTSAESFSTASTTTTLRPSTQHHEEHSVLSRYDPNPNRSQPKDIDDDILPDMDTLSVISPMEEDQPFAPRPRTHSTHSSISILLEEYVAAT